MHARLSLDTTQPHDFDPPALDWNRCSLDQIMRQHGSDKSSLDHGYCEIYERYLKPMRADPVRLLEIGVACGASLKGWSRYFPLGWVHGVDIRPECQSLCQAYEHIAITIGDATKQSQGRDYDVIIDDGSHVSQDIVRAFVHHWPGLKPGGFYCIEDTRCSWSGYRTHLQMDDRRYKRSHYMELIDHLMRKCDDGFEVDYIHHHRELTIVRKRDA